MLISKTKKIISSLLLLFIITSIFLPFNKVRAAGETVTLTRTTCAVKADKWFWGFKITSTGITDNTKVYVYLYSKGVAVGDAKTTMIKNNNTLYTTDYILEPNTNYSINVTVPDFPKLVTPSYADTTPQAGETSCDPNAIPPVTATNTAPPNTKTTYTLLQPLPGLEGANQTIDTKANPDTNPCPLGNYLNIMIKLFFGICGVLAVIMIVMGGIEYMTSDLISSKEAGKESIRNAVLGLLLALGSYLILNTINPDLLNICLNALPKAEMTMTEAPPTSSDFNPNESIPNGSIKSCTEGISKPSVSTSGGNITVCNKIAANTKALVNKAWTEGYKISGWGYRSYETQKALRIKNGCPDVMTSPANKCKTPTAIPGTSMHESGLAIDFTCDGASIQAHDNKCFIWLQKNSTGFLKNLSTEPWHWSTNGN